MRHPSRGWVSRFIATCGAGPRPMVGSALDGGPDWSHGPPSRGGIATKVDRGVIVTVMVGPAGGAVPGFRHLLGHTRHLTVYIGPPLRRRHPRPNRRAILNAPRAISTSTRINRPTPRAGTSNISSRTTPTPCACAPCTLNPLRQVHDPEAKTHVHQLEATTTPAACNPPRTEERPPGLIRSGR
jgi:hypothetical protein